MTTANSIDSDIPIPVSKGGLGAVSHTSGAVLLGSGSGSITALDVTAKGSLLVGDGTTDPVALAVSTNDYVLTADSTESSGLIWKAASGGGGGLAFISSATASGSASLTFTTGIDSTYTNYIFMFNAVLPSTDAVTLYMRTSTDGGSTYDSGSTDYHNFGMRVKGNIETVEESDDGFIALTILTQGNLSTESLTGQVVLVDPATATNTRATIEVAYTYSSLGYNSYTASSYRNSTTDVDAVQFLYSSGNIASGTISLYGMTPPS